MKKTAMTAERVRAKFAHIAGMNEATDAEIGRAQAYLRAYVGKIMGKGGVRPGPEKRDEVLRNYLVGLLRRRGVAVGSMAQASAAEKAGVQAADTPAAGAYASLRPSGKGGLVHFSFMPGETDSELCAGSGPADGITDSIKYVDCPACLSRLYELARRGMPEKGCGCGCNGNGQACGGHDAQVELEHMTDRLNDADAEVCRLREMRQALAVALRLTADALRTVAES